MPPIEIGSVDCVVEQPRLVLILPLHCCNAALFLEPFADQAEDVNSPRVWSVVKRFVLDVNPIIEHRWQSVGYSLQQVVAQDHERHAAWSHVLLSAGINHSIFVYCNCAGKNV